MVYRIWKHPKIGDDYAVDYSDAISAALAAKRSPTAEKVVYKAEKSLMGKETPIEIKKILKRVDF